jgi:murein L,D-transpeptidase YcbB/YkuD
MFPNTHDVYIHDTPDKYLFDRTLRSFSSGCIRVQEPLKLAEYLLAHDGSGRKIGNLIGRGVNKNIFLSRPVKVFITYWTVWEDDEGEAHFRSDVYGYDRELAEMMGWDYDLR